MIAFSDGIPKWRSKDGRVLELSEIDTVYLRNILNYLKTQSSIGMRTRFVSFVEAELSRRENGRLITEKIVETPKVEEPDFVDLFLKILEKTNDSI